MKFSPRFLLINFLLFMSLISCSEDEIKPADPVLLATPESFEFTSDGGIASLEIKANTAWKVSNLSDWTSVSKQNSEGNGTLTLTVATNPNQNIRSARISIQGGGKTIYVEVTQQGAGNEMNYAIPPDDSQMRNLTSVELAKQIQIGWNLGNSLEAIGGETVWGNPAVTKLLIDSVKAAGFQAVRIPIAWSRFSNATNFTIDPVWMNRVEEVVGYVLANDMYAIINIHWDNGWIQPTFASQAAVTHRLDIMWNQIATRFREYDDKLMFAGTNEVMVEGDYGPPSQEYQSVQNGFNQTFVKTVRSTGGRNAYRHLVVQAFNTNINNAVDFALIPEDVIPNRLMMEVHYYDPYNFALNENSPITQWGINASDPSLSEPWANESYVDLQFQKMKTNFIEKGIAVILGEYGAISRNDREGHEFYRHKYIEYITRSATVHGLVPFYWDNGFAGNHGFALFNRTDGKLIQPDLVKAIIGASNK